MTVKENVFILRFWGNNISPKSFGAKELGKLLIQMEDSIVSIVKDRYLEEDIEDIKISLVSIENKSESLAFDYGDNKNVRESVELFGRAIDSDRIIHLPKEAKNGVKLIYDYTKKKNCNTEFKHGKETLSKINPESKFIKDDNLMIEINSTIYGVLEKVGDDEPKIWVKLNDDKLYTVQVKNKDIAASLATKLYQVIAFDGKKKINTLTNEINSIKFEKIIDYTPHNAAKTFREIQSISSNFWDELDTQESITKFLING